MPSYIGTPDFEHGAPGRLGVLLVNLGTPDEPTPAAVRRYLAEFLWDPRVIETPRALWWLILHGVILRVRPRKSAHAYAQVWTPAGSPLLLYSAEVAARLGATLAERMGGGVEVALGMTYGNPSVASALDALRLANVRRLVVLPLYPQYSATTTASVFDRVTQALGRWRWIPELRFITQYHDDPAYIEALAESVRSHWAQHGRKHLLFSFHGLPKRYLLAGDPYHCQCYKTARLVAESLGIAPDDWSLSFQSRVGREEWLRPYTDEVLTQYAQQGPRQITAICPGFATDCLETLEEIAIRNREDFLAQGGEAFDYVPALNADAAHVDLLAGLVERAASGWPRTSDAATDAVATRERARALGAVR
ncbi:MAG TPA: ferrochelatase [Steroidobacteraceae bacterium]|nr:ferrochelatase [Steroidobacteraceae bacterium]